MSYGKTDSTMECTDARISAWIDGELLASEASEVERHVARCSTCGTLANALRQTSRALARLPENELVPDPGFLVRFRARRDDLSVAPWWTWRELALRLLPLAALVLVAAALSVLLSSSVGRPVGPVGSDANDRNLSALELEALGSPAGLDATGSGEPVLSIALAPFPPER
jgi:anti-sigma factor RsiW